MQILPRQYRAELSTCRRNDDEFNHEICFKKKEKKSSLGEPSLIGSNCLSLVV